VIVEIAMGASAEEPERNASLGIFYDEVLRKEVENKCGQLGTAWEYSSLFTQVDEGLLRKARRFALLLVVVCVTVALLRVAGNLMRRIRKCPRLMARQGLLQWLMLAAGKLAKVNPCGMRSQFLPVVRCRHGSAAMAVKMRAARS